VTPGATKIGIDDRGSYFSVARVNDVSGRPQIEALVRLERSTVAGHTIFDNAEPVFAVADDMVTKNELTIAGREQFDAESLARFEIAQSLLDDSSEFSYDLLPLTKEGDRCLGMTVRRSHLSDLTQPFAATLGDGLAGARYALRAEALGRGYLCFAHAAPGDLVCLIDLADHWMTLCLIHEGEINGVADLSLRSVDMDRPGDFERAAVELKTIVNFKLSGGPGPGLRVPLSSLVLSGRPLNSQARETLGKYFRAPIAEVAINRGFFGQPEKAEDTPVSEYLVALGLTAVRSGRF